MRRSRGIESLVWIRRFSGSSRRPVESLLCSRSLRPVLHHLVLLRDSHVVQYFPGVQRGTDVLPQNHGVPLPHHLLSGAHRDAVSVAGSLLGRGSGVVGFQRVVDVRQGFREGFLRVGLWEARFGGLFTLQHNRAAGLGHNLWESAGKVAANILGVNRFSQLVIGPVY